MASDKQTQFEPLNAQDVIYLLFCSLSRSFTIFFSSRSLSDCIKNPFNHYSRSWHFLWTSRNVSFVFTSANYLLNTWDFLGPFFPSLKSGIRFEIDQTWRMAIAHSNSPKHATMSHFNRHFFLSSIQLISHFKQFLLPTKEQFGAQSFSQFYYFGCA